MNEYYSDLEDENKNMGITPLSSFTVKVQSKMYIIYAFGLAVPVFFFAFFFKFLRSLRSGGLELQVDMFVLFLVFIFLLFLLFAVEGAGKRLEVFGKSITVKRWFFISEAITLNDVKKCDVIYDLTVYNKYGTRRYNKAVVYYGDNKNISFIDTNYSNWQSLVDYMAWNGKTEKIDGRSRVERFVDDKFSDYYRKK